MPTLCSAYNCKNRGPKADVGFFSFPKNDPERRMRWIINMKWKDWNPQHHHRVCSIHFEDKYICRMDKRQRLTPDAVPTIFDFPENFQKKKASIHPQSRRARSDGLPGKYTSAPAVTVAEPVITPSLTITSETSKLAKDNTKAPEKVTSSSWYIHVDEEIQMAESLPGFFHSDYCLPHSIRWGFKDDVAPKVACENMEFQLPPLKHIIEITEAWEWLGMDIRGPLPLTPNGHQYVLTLTDFYSKWVEAFPLRGCSSTEVAQHVAEVISHFGFPFGILVRLKRKFTSKINLALNSHLKLRGFSLLYRHRQVGSLDLATQTLISRMVSDLVKDHPYNWDVCLPAKVFSLCFKEHPKTKQRPFSLLCCKGPQPVTTPRDLSVSLLCSYSLTLIIMDCISIEWVCFCLSFLFFLQFSPAELGESSFAIQSNQEGGHDTDPQDMVGIESGKETAGKSTVMRVSFLRSNTESNNNTDGNTYGHPDSSTAGNPDGSTAGNPDGSTAGNPDTNSERSSEEHHAMEN
uniref:THAP domain-containing protein 1 n=1 Tax=Salmo trutta TaxID=8032 RepID=A0A674BDK2_SALTR